MTPEQKILDRYYHKEFGWSLAEVDVLFASQGNVCNICGRLPGKYRLSLDHDHRFDKIKIRAKRELGGGFYEVTAFSEELSINIKWTAEPDKSEAIETLRRHLRRKSVRGGLCLRCNKGIQMFEDSKAPLSPEQRFDNAAKYFREFKSKSS